MKSAELQVLSAEVEDHLQRATLSSQSSVFDFRLSVLALMLRYNHSLEIVDALYSSRFKLMMSDLPLASIVITTYTRERYLGDRIASILAQTNLLLIALPLANISAGQVHAAILPAANQEITEGVNPEEAIPEATDLTQPSIQSDVHPETIDEVEIKNLSLSNSNLETSKSVTVSDPQSTEAIAFTNPLSTLSSESNSVETAIASSTQTTFSNTINSNHPIQNQTALIAQSITPAADGTHTVVTPNGNRLDITGGQLSGDRTNLFHSFSQFGLTQNQIANFIANPQLRNILGRVVGGNPSVIDGLIQVTGGTPNLYLANPAGIVFGPNARLNVPSSFTATTANGIQFGDRWFDVTGSNTYSDLNGTPNGFAFTMSQPGAVINAGNLAVNSGQSITLAGGTVVNTGQLSAPGGQVVVAAVPGEHLVRISQPGQLLSLEIDPSTLQNQLQDWTLPIATLPQLLTGAGSSTTPGLAVNSQGEATLTASNTPIPSTPGTAIVSGSVDVSNLTVGQTGGTVAVVGDRVGLINTQINASGDSGGGTVLIGGDYHGQGALPNALRTFVSNDSSIQADAVSQGNGGRVIFWSDEATDFYGQISAQGGQQSGNGGFTEVSGAQHLTFAGNVNLSASNGQLGTLLLDPTNIVITNPPIPDITYGSGLALFATPTDDSLTISDAELEQQSTTANIVLQATNNITVEPLDDGVLNLTRSLTLTADADQNGTGQFTMSPFNTIRTQGGNITISGTRLTLGTLQSNGGTITLTATGTGTGNGVFADQISAGSGDVTITGDEIDVSAGYGGSIDSTGNLILQPFTPSLNIEIGGSGDTNALDLTAGEINSLGGGFNSITIGRANGEGKITVANDVSFSDPVIIQAPVGDGSITSTGATIDGFNDASITLLANQNITTGSIFSPAGITITSTRGTIDATNGRLNTSPQNDIGGNAGAIALTAGADIIITDLNANDGSEFGYGGTGGDITLRAENNISTNRMTSIGELGNGNIRIASANGIANLSGETTGRDITVSGREVRFTSTGETSPSVSTDSGRLVIQPATAEQNLIVQASDPNVFQNGFSSITIGRPDGSGKLTLANALTFSDPVLLQAPAGSLQINGILQGLDNGSITLVGSGSTTTLNADIRTASTPITINDSVILGTNVTLDTTLRGTGANIAIAGTINSTVPGNQGLTLRAGTGNIQLGNAIGGTVPLQDLQVLSAQQVNIASNITTANGAIRFQNIGDRVNLTGSSTFDAGTGAVSFNNASLNTGNNDLTITANEIDFLGKTQVSGTGSVLFQPATPALQIAVGGTGDTGTNTLDLTQSDLNALQNGFRRITIGRSNSSSAIAILNTLTFADPVTLRSPTGNGSITTNGNTLTGIDNASITLLANQDITTANITAPAGIRINSSNGNITTRNLTTANTGSSGNITVTSPQGAIRTGSLNASSSSGNGGAIALTARNTVTSSNITTQASEGIGGTIAVTSRDGAVRTGNLRSTGVSGGDVRVVASDRIQTGQIDSSASVGDGGDVFLDPSGNITVGFINAQGGENGLGGTVDITTGQLFLASDRFTDRNGINASISTAGGNGGGAITIRHGGGGLRIPFDVGDATVNGTAGAITTGTEADGTIFPFRSFPGSYTQGDIRIITQDPPVAPPQTDVPSSLPDIPPLDVTPSTPLRTLADAREILQQIEDSTGIRPALIYAQFVPSPTPAAAWFDQREASFTEQFEEHLQGRSNIAAQPLLTARDTDELELLLVTAEGPPVARRLRGVTRAQVMAVANRFRNEVTDVRKTRTRSYLGPAQQLYNWLVAPLAADLQARQVQNLVFLPDVGLRSVPFAALHDGSGFLIEHYSVGLMPSLSLADTRYVDVRDSEVLAMGASQFTNQIALPAVPVELSAIAHQLWRGETFLNQNFTTDNLRTQRQEHPFGIVHLATHAEFEPGTPDQSYIQFWNSQLRLDQLRQLGLNDPPVNLMVLSACRTALGNTDAELGFAGLATQAGVKSVMASLWYVSDAGTLTLMTEFYDQLRHAPIKAEALRQAQLLMAHGQIHLVNGQLQGLPEGDNVTLPPDFAELDDTDFSHPYYWSAFTMVGNPW